MTFFRKNAIEYERPKSILNIIVMCISMFNTGRLCDERMYRQNYSPGQSACPPDFTLSLLYPTIHLTLGVCLPIALIIVWNTHIVNIAKYHQYRKDSLHTRSSPVWG